MREKKLIWYENRTELAEAVSFLLKYDCCYGWEAFARKRTRCTDYNQDHFPAGLEDAVRSYIESLTRKEWRELSDQISGLLGERSYMHKASVVKILCRMMTEGDPRKGKGMIKLALEKQLDHRMKLYEELINELVRS